MNTLIEQAVAEAGGNEKLNRLALACLLGAQGQEFNRILATLLINIVSPKLEADGHTFEDMDEYHYGFVDLLACCAVGMEAKLLTHRHVKTIIDDVWNRYPCYGLFQYLNETGLLDEVGGDELDALLDKVIADNEKAVKEIAAGKDKAVGALVGQVMKQLKTDPAEVKTRLFAKIRGKADGS